MNKRGQIAIFVIVAIVIVGAIIVLFAYPKISSVGTSSETSPEQYLRECIQQDVKNSIKLLAEQGGEQNPTGYINYLDTKIKYLCYISGNFRPCLIQQPMLITNFEKELSTMLTSKLDSCAKRLITEYEARGYSVSSSEISSEVSLGSGKVSLKFNAPMTITREETSRKFDNFEVNIDSKIYDLLSIATSIMDYESTYGDSEITNYFVYYPDLKIEKIKVIDSEKTTNGAGVKIYKLTNIVTNEMFQFATRSLVWPGGYGFE